MRRDYSVGVKAGALSSIPIGIYLVATALPGAWRNIGSIIVEYPILAQYANIILVVTSLVLVIMFLGFALLFGAIAGFLFVVLVNKLPVRSTYVKAVGTSLLVWILLVLVPAFLYRLSISVIIVDVRALLPQLGLFVFDAFIFSYLFGRWRNLTNPGTQILD